MKKEVWVEVLAALVMLLFLYSSTSKLLDLKGFASDMRNQVFPMWFAKHLVWAVPASEIAISMLLMFEKTRLLGFRTALILMSLFTVYTVTVLFRWYGRVPCSCGGVIRKLSWRQHILLNFFYVAISIIGIRLQKWKLAKYKFA